MSAKEKYKWKKRVMAVIAILLAVTMVLGLIVPFIGYGVY